ncbi:hypothetical protein MGYG_04101 [Nannizzia gypsea CBS 118893]|uniref:2EXR domain-containing protein n=1 Tax=Arthroderma gypseum (strain ATCC MYA-4604 / CBS 118893) TaxID=535722 RepID=E4UUY0_ARTGP|nr:hypothetical protein MGYG_04101 [Nannizzia gypsea CBS 118893]EFR01097.1 hypothetical protein MGYG_04101 [Nannizzia gypsea CBS 118893]
MATSRGGKPKKHAVATSFPQFRKLPAELQLMIWEEAFYATAPTQKVIEGFVEEDAIAQHAHRIIEAVSRVASMYGGDGIAPPAPARKYMPSLMTFPAAQIQSPAPAMAYVCRDSRRVFLKLGHAFTSLLFDDDEESTMDVWFDFSSDIVYFPLLGTEIRDSFCWASSDNWEYRRRIQHLAVEWSFFHQIDDVMFTYELHWLETFIALYNSFPALTDLYIFVPAVRLAEAPASSSGSPSERTTLCRHFEEPDECESLPIILKPIPISQTIRLAKCHCPERPRNWDETIVEIEAAFRSPWMKDALHRELKEKADNFPPRLHERIFLRKGLDVDALRDVEPPPGLKILIDRSILGRKKDRM